jgi:hypothetical protein
VSWIQASSNIVFKTIYMDCPAFSTSSEFWIRGLHEAWQKQHFFFGIYSNEASITSMGIPPHHVPHVKHKVQSILFRCTLYEGCYTQIIMTCDLDMIHRHITMVSLRFCGLWNESSHGNIRPVSFLLSTNKGDYWSDISVVCIRWLYLAVLSKEEKH